MATGLNPRRPSRGVALKERGRNPRSRTALRERIDELNDQILSMQSLDDLGSPEANDKADKCMQALQRERDTLERELKTNSRR